MKYTITTKERQLALPHENRTAKTKLVHVGVCEIEILKGEHATADDEMRNEVLNALQDGFIVIIELKP